MNLWLYFVTCSRASIKHHVSRQSSTRPFLSADFKTELFTVFDLIARHGIDRHAISSHIFLTFRKANTQHHSRQRTNSSNNTKAVDSAPFRQSRKLLRNVIPIKLNPLIHIDEIVGKTSL